VGGNNDLESFILGDEITMGSFVTGCAFILGLGILLVCETIREVVYVRNK